MKNLFTVLLLLLCFGMACGGPAEKQESEAEQAPGSSNANLATSLGNTGAETAVEASTQTALTLAASSPTFKTGETGCVDVMVADFYNLLSMQYSMQWDPKVLAFNDVQGFNLPYLGKNSFGTHRTREGLLTFVWIDDALDGRSLTDGSTIFQVCFEAVGPAGQSSSFRFVDQPTPFEVVNQHTQVIPLKAVDGKVTIN